MQNAKDEKKSGGKDEVSIAIINKSKDGRGNQE